MKWIEVEVIIYIIMLCFKKETKRQNKITGSPYCLCALQNLHAAVATHSHTNSYIHYIHTIHTHTHTYTHKQLSLRGREKRETQSKHIIKYLMYKLVETQMDCMISK